MRLSTLAIIVVLIHLINIIKLKMDLSPVLFVVPVVLVILLVISCLSIRDNYYICAVFLNSINMAEIIGFLLAVFVTAGIVLIPLYYGIKLIKALIDYLNRH